MKMLLVSTLLAALIVCSLADEDHHDEHKCGPLAKIKLRRQWDKSYGEGSHRLDFGVKFWHGLFKDHPKVRDTFKAHRSDNVYSAEFQAMGARLLGAFGMFIETTDDPAALKVLIQKVKTDHAEKGIDAHLYDAVHEQFLEIIPEYLGFHFDYDAWHDCLTDFVAALK